jgi:F0F1-type ATP synthase membrane subunit b/b'
MNTLTSQEINTMPVTNEEEEAMRQLTNKEEEAMQQLTNKKEEAMQQLTNNHVQEVCTTTTQPESGLNVDGIIDDMMSRFQYSLRLLITSVISQTQRNSLAEKQSLQDCVTTVLQQGSWFTEKVNKAVEDADIEDIVKDAVHEEVTSIVESYFNYEFQLSDHVDINDMVREQVEEKFENIKISFD